MSSKTLLINGSPNTEGYTMQLTKAIFDDATYDILHAYDLHINSCDDCKVCSHKPTCKYNHDDMQKVLDYLPTIDTLILVTPVYFGAMSDQLLTIINRFQQLFEQKFTHNLPTPSIENLYVVCSAGANNNAMVEGIKLTTNILSSLFDTTQCEVFSFLHTDGVKEVQTHYKQTINHYQSLLKKR